MLFRSRASASDHEKTVMRGVVKLQAAVRRKRAHSSFLRMDETDALPLRDAWAIWLFLAHVIAVVWVGSPFLGAESYLGEAAFEQDAGAPPAVRDALCGAQYARGFRSRCCR